MKKIFVQYRDKHLCVSTIDIRRAGWKLVHLFRYICRRRSLHFISAFSFFDVVLLLFIACTYRLINLRYWFLLLQIKESPRILFRYLVFRAAFTDLFI